MENNFKLNIKKEMEKDKRNLLFERLDFCPNNIKVDINLELGLVDIFIYVNEFDKVITKNDLTKSFIKSVCNEIFKIFKSYNITYILVK